MFSYSWQKLFGEIVNLVIPAFFTKSDDESGKTGLDLFLQNGTPKRPESMSHPKYLKTCQTCVLKQIEQENVETNLFNWLLLLRLAKTLNETSEIKLDVVFVQ